MRTLLAGTVVAAALLSGCSADVSEPPAAPELRSTTLSRQSPDLRAALAAQERHTGRLMAMRGVVGTAVALNPAGKPTVKIFTANAGTSGLPASLDGIPAVAEVVGTIFARSDPTTRQRPAPIGFSVGHPDITAGTIGARVKDGSGNVYILSNNHVLANSNSAQLDDSALQPGPLDGGTAADRIGGLFAFEVLNLGIGGFEVDPPTNMMDAAIALSSTAVLSNSTPTDDGYGVPSSVIFGDAGSDGFFDNVGQLLGVPVQKYGRTTKLTQGQITEVNVTIDVCYDIFCFMMGRFLDQIGICCADFSDGGDSGSLVVSRDAGKNPIGLLFAGGDGRTFANRIDLVLKRFNVSVDASASSPPPPPPPQSMHVGDLDGLGSIQGRTWAVSVTIKIEDGAHNPVSGATVSGSFSAGASGNASCTTGTSGTCFVTKSRLRNGSVTFTVTGVTHATRTYQSSNHDPDGDSNGTTITVARP